MNKNFTDKAGYGGLLDFDPANGIVKYGSYEAYLTQLVAPSSTSIISFDDWAANWRRQNGQSGLASARLGGVDQDQLRQLFTKSMVSGPLQDQPRKLNILDSANSATLGPAPIGDLSTIASKPTEYTTAPTGRVGYRQVKNLGGDRYEVSDYFVPSGVDFVNKLAESGTQLSQSMRDDDLLKQNQQDAANRRQGAGSTVLSASGAAAAINS